MEVSAECEQWIVQQEELKSQLILENTDDWQKCSGSFRDSGLKLVGGVDLSYVKDDNSVASVALIVLSYPELEVVHEDISLVTITTPYVSGFLAFREVEFLVEKINNLKINHPHLLPQAILVDGNGILHPRGFGLASHLGVLIDMPTVGVAKKLLHVDGLEKSPEFRANISDALKAKGDTFPLTGNSGRELGVALKTQKDGHNAVFVSVGHRFKLETAARLVTELSNFRIPEPVRQADIRSREFLRKHGFNLKE